MSTLDQTEKTADRIRTELLSTLKELDRRRHEMTDVRHQVSQHLGLVAAAGGLLLAGLVSTIAILRFRSHSRRTLALRDRARAFIRAWEHPNRIATRAKHRPLPLELARKAALVFASAMAGQLAKRTAAELVPPKRRALPA
jgi:hypothetical protein